jgi:hypothetical protein
MHQCLLVDTGPDVDDGAERVVFGNGVQGCIDGGEVVLAGLGHGDLLGRALGLGELDKHAFGGTCLVLVVMSRLTGRHGTTVRRRIHRRHLRFVVGARVRHELQPRVHVVLSRSYGDT